MIDDFGRAFLRLTLEINKLIDGYIDAYIGPPEIKAEVAAAPPREPAALLDDLSALQATIPREDPARQAYLQAVLTAMDCTLRMQQGERPGYLDEVNRLYDIQPQKVDESSFLDARRELDTLLPGSGDLNDRMETRRKRYELAPEQALPLIELATTVTRERTQALVELVPDEAVEVRLTSNQPWSAYNWYLGRGRSLIEFNTDIPISAIGLLGTFAHEGYPGHHTESQLKERHLYQEKGYAEYAALLLHSPAAVIAEGIATTAAEIIFPEGDPAGDIHEWNEQVLLPAAGMTGETAAQMRRLQKASRQLSYVSGNAAILYHTGQLDQKQTIDYIRTYSLANPDRARKSFSFLSHPLFRAYLFTYTEGYDLIQQAGPEQKKALFLRLLHEQILPSQLAAR